VSKKLFSSAGQGNDPSPEKSSHPLSLSLFGLAELFADLSAVESYLRLLRVLKITGRKRKREEGKGGREERL